MDALLRRMLRLPGRAAAGNGCWFYTDRLEVWLQEAAEVRAGWRGSSSTPQYGIHPTATSSGSTQLKSAPPAHAHCVPVGAATIARSTPRQSSTIDRPCGPNYLAVGAPCKTIY